jgi:Spy/CpxP family protein refolding chaperone
MKKARYLLLLFFLAGVAAFSVVHLQKKAAQRKGMLLDNMPELAWVRSALKLTDRQFAEISELHAAYRPKCEEMCRRIAEAHEKLHRLAEKEHVATDELNAAIREHANIHAECQETMLRHLYQTAGTLEPQQAEKYLKTMLPYALDFNHGEPEALSHP